MFASPTKNDFTQVNVLDSLIGKCLKIRISSSTTVLVMKYRIQSAQAQSGLRLLPIHMLQVTIEGKEYPDDALVLEVMKGEGLQSIITIEPRVPELVSFFLSSVSDLRDQDPSQPSISTVDESPDAASRIFGEMDDLGIDDEEEIGSVPSGARTPDSASTVQQSPCISPCMAGHSIFTELDIALESMSAQTTPDLRREHSLPFQALALPAAAAKSYDGREALATFFMSQPPVSPFLALASPVPARLCGGGGGGGATAMGAVLLREVSAPDEPYTSHLHLLVRNMAQARPFLQRFKWGSLAELVLQVQSGLRHGHCPRQGGPTSSSRRATFDYGTLVAHCCGGTYVMSDSTGLACAVFKPADEEPYAPRNPKGYSGSLMGAESAMKPGVAVGGGAARECAAFLLDHEVGLLCVRMYVCVDFSCLCAWQYSCLVLYVFSAWTRECVFVCVNQEVDHHGCRVLFGGRGGWACRARPWCT